MGKSLAMAKKRGPAPKPDERRESSMAFRCKADYKDWVIRLARKHRMTPSQLIDAALVRFAEAADFEAPPER